MRRGKVHRRTKHDLQGLRAGQYQDATSGNANCKNCAAGKSAAAGGASDAVCLSCTTGTYALAGSSTCTACAKGTYTLEGATKEAGTDCQGCKVGRYATTQGAVVATADVAATCINCAAGNYAAATGTSECTKCESGRYTNAAEQTTCTGTKCVKRTGGALGSTTINACNTCCAGQDSGSSVADEALDGQTCKACKAGFFSAAWGDACTAQICSAGTKLGTNTGSTAAAEGCIPCDKGFYAAAGDNACTKCAAGTYADETGTTTCKATMCDEMKKPVAACAVKAGGVNPNCAGATTSALCTTASTDGGVIGAANVCEYSTQIAAGSCDACASGQYRFTFVDRATCFASSGCAKGYEPSGEGMTSDATSASGCSKCAKGMYSDTTDNTACKDCGGGTYAAETGLAACVTVPCAAGEYEVSQVKQTAATGLCAACNAGKYNMFHHKEACDDVIATCTDGTKSAGWNAAKIGRAHV